MDTGYRKLLIAVSINAVIMYFVTYAMIATIDHFHFNLNRVYMALMMTAPMVIVMLIVMRDMYTESALNLLIMAIAAGLFVFVFWLARTQTSIGDGQFLRSMIPHHSSAILMCKEAPIRDPDIIELCQQIIRSQRDEIAQIEEMLSRAGR